jgi:mRNA-degrading endonuclease RelE of RelBE toxin-antitoxin system
MKSLHSLENLPRRCPLAREAKQAKRPIRCLLFGKRHGIYRILYEISEKRRTVYILHIRHGALADLAAGELTELPDG